MAEVFVTGGAGFLGAHLLAALGSSDRIAAFGRRPPRSRSGEIPFVRGDLEDSSSVVEAVLQVAPRRVFHVAGRTPPAATSALFRANTLATANLLEALSRLPWTVRVVVVGSAAEYGPVPPGCLPIGEGCPCRPSGPYAMSKWAATCLSRRPRPNVEVVIARVFNPIGPGAPPEQVFGRFARWLTSLPREPVRRVVPDLHARRDFVDVRDVATALIALGDLGRPGTIYAVGTGASRPIAEGLDHLIRLSGRNVSLSPDPTAARGPSDSRADIRALREATGWQPSVPFERSLRDLWEDVQPDGAGPAFPKPHLRERDRPADVEAD